jgi:HlyD family secretion protein
MPLPPLKRSILPILAVGALGVSAYLVMTGEPDRNLRTPEKTPALAPQKTNSAATMIAASGVIEPTNETTDVGTNVSGIVTRVYVEIGQRVTKGTPLFEVDSRQVRSTLNEAETGMTEANASITAAEAAMTEAQTNIRTAERQLALYRQVSDPRAISRAEVIAAEGAVADARARLTAARAQMTAAQARRVAANARRGSAQTELQRHVVYAPSTGEVLDIEIRAGEFASAGGQGGNVATPYIQIGETQPLHVRIDIDENEATRFAAGSSATLSPRGNPDQKLRVQFVRIEPQIVPKRSLTNTASERVDVRVMQVIYALPVGDSVFRIGQQVDAFVEIMPQSAGK